MIEKKKMWVEFLPQWVIANALGWSSYSSTFILPFHKIWLSFAVACFISYLQWRILKKHINIDSMWFWASTLVYGVYLWILFTLAEKYVGFITISDAIYTIMPVFGVLSLVQRAVLKSYVNMSFIWVVINPVAGILSFLPFFLVFIYNRSTLPSSFVIWGSYGMTYGIITGIILVLLYISTTVRSQNEKINS